MVVDGSDTTSYQYDATYQQTKVTYPDSSTHDFDYDANGCPRHSGSSFHRRTHRGGSAAAPARLRCRSDANAAPRPMLRERRLSAYDGNGAMTARADGTTTWDYYHNCDGRLYDVDKDSSSVQTNTYNPDGTRRSIGCPRHSGSSFHWRTNLVGSAAAPARLRCRSDANAAPRPRLRERRLSA